MNRLLERFQEIDYVGSNNPDNYMVLLNRAIKEYCDANLQGTFEKPDYEVDEYVRKFFTKEEIKHSYNKYMEMNYSLQSKVRQVEEYKLKVSDLENQLKNAKRADKKRINTMLYTAKFYLSNHERIMNDIINRINRYGEF